MQDHARTSDKISSGSSQHLLTRTSTRSCLKLLQDRHSRTFQKTHKKYFYQDLTESTKISIGPQRGRSDTHKVPRGLRERHPHSNRPTTRAIRQPQSSERVARSHVRFSQNLARTTKHEHLKKSKTTFLPRSHPLLRRGLQSTAPATKNEPEASEVLHVPHGIIIMSAKMTTLSQTRLSTLSRHHPGSPNTAPATKNYLQKHLSF